MTRDAAIARAIDNLDSGAFEVDLARRVAIPSESQTAEGLAHCARYLEDEMVPAFAAMGFKTRIFANPVEGCGPVLLAARHEEDGLPTVLGYGHGDVIRGQAERWTKGEGPWRAVRDGDRIYGRGTADNKGQHSINMAALKAVLEARGRLGFNAKFMVETGEEVGSTGLAEIVAANRDAFAADVLIASDGPRADPARPTVSLGARGALNFDLVCDLREGAHHSGNWGGALADPAALIAHAIAAIVGPEGRILVPDWLPTLDDATRKMLAEVPIGGWVGAPEVDPDWGEPGLTTAEKVFAWNSFAVLAMTAGAPEAPVNAIAPSARAHCQLRYVAGTDEARIIPALREHLAARGVERVEVVPPPEANAGAFAASRTEADEPWVATVCDSIEKTIGAPPTIIPQMGGSICNALFTDMLGIPAIWLPHSYGGCAQHAPDEHLLVPVARDALRLMAGLYWDIGAGA